MKHKIKLESIKIKLIQNTIVVYKLYKNNTDLYGEKTFKFEKIQNINICNSRLKVMDPH